MPKKVTKKNTAISLNAEQGAIVVEADGSIQIFLHDQPGTEKLSLANFKVGLIAFALQDVKTLKMLLKNFEKQAEKLENV